MFDLLQIEKQGNARVLLKLVPKHSNVIGSLNLCYESWLASQKMQIGGLNPARGERESTSVHTVALETELMLSEDT